MNYFSNSKVDQATAETPLGCISMRTESLLSLLAVVLAVSLSNLPPGYHDAHRPDNCPSYQNLSLATCILDCSTIKFKMIDWSAPTLLFTWPQPNCEKLEILRA